MKLLLVKKFLRLCKKYAHNTIAQQIPKDLIFFEESYIANAAGILWRYSETTL